MIVDTERVRNKVRVRRIRRVEVLAFTQGSLSTKVRAVRVRLVGWLGRVRVGIGARVGAFAER